MYGRKRSFSPTVRELVYRAQHGICKNCLQPMTDYHHRLPNTKTNNRLYPKFLHSIFNCVGLCRRDHEQMKHLFIVMPDEAMAYEAWLSTEG